MAYVFDYNNYYRCLQTFLVYLTDLTKSVKNNSHVLMVIIIMMMMKLIMGLNEIAEAVIISLLYI